MFVGLCRCLFVRLFDCLWVTWLFLCGRLLGSLFVCLCYFFIMFVFVCVGLLVGWSGDVLFCLFV